MYDFVGRFYWQTGAEQILLTSIGTGFRTRCSSVDEVLEANVWDWALEVPMMLIEDASMQNQLMLQWLSQSPTPLKIGMEVGDLSDGLPASHVPSYLNGWLSQYPRSLCKP